MRCLEFRRRNASESFVGIIGPDEAGAEPGVRRSYRISLWFDAQRLNSCEKSRAEGGCRPMDLDLCILPVSFSETLLQVMQTQELVVGRLGLDTVMGERCKAEYSGSNY